MRTRAIVVVPDLQIPYHAPVSVTNLARFVKEFRPDELVNVGDDIDSPQPSHWSKGMAGEYAGDLQAHLDQAREVHAQFRDAIGSVPYHLSRSNHGDRLRKYVARYAPALEGLRALQLEELAGYRELDITYHGQPFEIAPGWVCAHGDEGSTSAIPGRTAGNLADRWGVSVVCGHTHSAGLCPTTRGYAGKVTQTVWGMEVGHMMALKSATYLPGGHGNWQQAFGILYVSGDRTTPVVVPVAEDGRFTVEGVEYGT